MILLKATTESLQLVTSSTAAIDYSISYADITTTTFTPSTNEGKITTAATSAVLAAPTTATQRQIKLITISNRDASLSDIVYLQKLITATSYNLTPSFTLLAGETAQYMDGQGWTYYSVTGAVKGDQTAAGSTTQLQYNNAGVLGGDPDLVWNNATNDLLLGGVDTGITLTGITNEPGTPAAGSLHLYAKAVASKMIVKVKGASGLDFPLQTAFWQNNIVLWNPSSATAGVWLGTTGTAFSSGTFTAVTQTFTNTYTAQSRSSYANVVTTTNQVLGVRQSSKPMYFFGSAANQGGFFFYTRMGFDVWTNGGRMFVGMTVSTTGTPVSADASTNANTVGFCIEAADNGLIYFLTRSATTFTKTSTGFTAASLKGYDMYIWANSNSTTVNYRIVDTVAGTEISGTTSATMPTANTLMMPNVTASNGALTPVTSVSLGIDRIYIETDY
jgi:hypothetical protein